MVEGGGGWKRYGKQVEMSKVIKHFPVPDVICFLFSDIPPSWTENEKRPGTIFHRIYSPVQFDSCPVSLFAPSRDIARFSFSNVATFRFYFSATRYETFYKLVKISLSSMLRESRFFWRKKKDISRICSVRFVEKLEK